MDQPWLTIALLFAAFWLAMGVFATRDALRERHALHRLGVRGIQTKGEMARGPRRDDPRPTYPRSATRPHPWATRTPPPSRRIAGLL